MLIECEGLTKRYGRTRALDGVDLALASGSPIALVGPNGAGKTTLLSVLCGFVRAGGGTARVLGEAAGSRALRGRLAALPQDATLAPGLAIGAQLAHLARLQGLSRAAARHESARVLDRVGLGEATGAAPETLSHGMRKRVSLAQALMGAPELLLLDEPTAGVDPPNVRIIQALVRELASDVDILISSHNLDELERMTERVVYLEAGRVGERGLVASDAGAGDASSGWLTLTLERPADTERSAHALSELVDVRSARSGQPGVVELQTADPARVAIEVLTRCANDGIAWRRLQRGRTLEARLYDDPVPGT